MTRFEYVTLPVNDVLPLTAPAAHPDSYLSDDTQKQQLDAILAKGFRWVRTDGDIAVFERTWTKYPALEKR